MMKTVLLLVIAAVCVSAAPSRINEKRLLMLSVFDELNSTMNAMNDRLKQNMPDVFLSDLKVKRQLHCSHEFFCQAEKELRRKVSGLSGATFEPFHTEKVLIRNLNKFNQHHKNSCESADDKLLNDEISLPEFLQDLKRCVQNRISTSAK